MLKYAKKLYLMMKFFIQKICLDTMTFAIVGTIYDVQVLFLTFTCTCVGLDPKSLSALSGRSENALWLLNDLGSNFCNKGISDYPNQRKNWWSYLLWNVGTWLLWQSSCWSSCTLHLPTGQCQPSHVLSHHWVPKYS